MQDVRTLVVEFRYQDDDEAKLENVLEAFGTQAGGERKPYGERGGAIDLVTFLEVGIAFVAGVAVTPVLSKYFQGLLKADSLKEAGEKHRKLIDEWFSHLVEHLETLLRPVRDFLRVGFPRFTFDRKEKALALRFHLGQSRCFVVLNHAVMSPSLLARLPRGIIRMLRYVAESKLPEDAHVLQLYVDPSDNDWRYLFMPTSKGFGRWIDRYVDLKTGEMIRIESQAKFQALFVPREEDGLKFLVSPFRSWAKDGANERMGAD